jgi:pyrroloquinoline quinone biosynthesis protein D
MPAADSRPTATDTFTSRDLEEEFLFYDSNGDQVHVLNGTAREIYLLCDGTRRPAEIATAMVERYEVEQEQALADVNETVDRLIEMGLLRT